MTEFGFLPIYIPELSKDALLQGQGLILCLLLVLFL